MEIINNAIEQNLNLAIAFITQIDYNLETKNLIVNLKQRLENLL
ncbi:hypothetical protein H1P_510026 [Hyella patelloides LEGE 07179]|uniref:Uncharacterized protein n=1 Tax=Hyella patelloides LEGE 07179 TaxID=945734 RepID=A0A563W078_9CYAN|nr:hypothetical protein [Hyella patelloides]VEP16923.1 hypothetical protein H1P_510026 [Hyella patelloides LEGE 07179]